MTRKRIQQLSALLPTNAPYLRGHNDRYLSKMAGATNRSHEVLRLAVCTNDPMFGWNFIRSFVDLNIGLPCEAADEALTRGYAVEMEGWHDPYILEALSLEQAPCNYLRGLVQAMLMDPQMGISEISDRLHIDNEVLLVYDQLFFNVRDRLDERAYLAQLAFPHGTMVEMQDDYATRESLDFLMRRAVLKHGFTEAMQVAGMDTTSREFDSAVIAERVKAMLYADGLKKLKFGMTGPRETQTVVRLLSAQEAGGGDQRNADDVMGLSAISAAGGVMDTIREIQMPSIIQRRQLQEAELVVAERRKKAAAAEAEEVEK